MSPPRHNVAILAAAGSRKTEHIVEAALAVTSGRVLITTYTNENQRHIVSRIENMAGSSPRHITVMGWCSFLIGQCAKPYQRALTGEPLLIRGLNFKGRRDRFTEKATLRYCLDANADMYRDGVSDVVVTLNRETNGAVVDRLERIFTHVFVDEVQDLVGYDLDVLDFLLGSRIRLMCVGDPRQHTFCTNLASRNKNYRGSGLADWFAERPGLCTLEPRSFSYRCNQALCDFADAIYPELPPTRSIDVNPTGHDGIFRVARANSLRYIAEHGPVTVMRYDKNVDTQGLPAMNIGLAKGRTVDRVVIVPTQPMLRYLDDRDVGKLRAPEKLYVAVTRARFSVAFVVPDP